MRSKLCLSMLIGAAVMSGQDMPSDYDAVLKSLSK